MDSFNIFLMVENYGARLVHAMAVTDAFGEYFISIHETYMMKPNVDSLVVEACAWWMSGF